MMALFAAPAMLLSSGDVRQHVVHEIYSKTLPAGSKPRIVPLPLKGEPIISAGEYRIEEQAVTRIYRYSFKGDIDDFANNAIAQLEGWRKDVLADNVGNPHPGQGYFLTSPPLFGPVRRDTMLVSKGRFVLDKHAKFGSKKKAEKGWISVSLNEEEG